MDWLQKHLDQPLVAGCSIAHKSHLLHVRRWDMDQTEMSKYTSNKMFSERISVILDNYYLTNVCLWLTLVLISYLRTQTHAETSWLTAETD